MKRKSPPPPIKPQLKPPLPFPIRTMSDEPTLENLEAPVDNKIGISIGVDKVKGLVVMQFAKPVSWLTFDSVSCANVMKLLGEQLKELQN